MKIKKIQWKSKKQKTRVILVAILILFGAYVLNNRRLIDKSWRSTYEQHPQIQVISYEDAVNFYAAYGYECELDKNRYTNNTFCYYADESQYPDIVLWTNKDDGLLMIQIKKEYAEIQESDTAFDLFINMSSDVLSLSDEEKNSFRNWASAILEENGNSPFRETKGFKGETFQIGLINGILDIEIGAQIRY